jgi:RHS repeat-associated protein
MTWDVKNRLAQVVIGGKTVSYVYDHNDWRVKKTVNGVETNYLYDGSLLLAETDASGKIQKIYINDGARIIGMVKYVYKPDGTFSHYMPMYYMFDSLDSVSAITAETGKPLQMYKYTPYGRVTNTIDDSENALRFIGAYGGYQDDDAGLTYFWHRWYDAQNGRWVSRDPIGVLGGINFYNYSGNDPVYLIDTNGLCLDLRSLIPFFTYGNYGAPGYTAGVWTLCTAPDWKVPPKDSLDRCYKNHDMCYHNACSDKCKLKNCDMALEFCLYDTLFGSSNFGYFGTAYGLTSGLFIGIKAGFGLY